MAGIRIEDITKKYGDTVALDHISMSFEENRIYGLLGRNGAGKSTLLNIISDRIIADSGSVLVDEEAVRDNDKMLSRIYSMNDRMYYPGSMKVKDAFRWSGEFYRDFDADYAKKLAKRFRLDTEKPVQALSTGYASIFKIIIALSVNTPYVLFDEPVHGLDINHRDLFYRLLLEKYSEQPFTAVVSTHIIDEIAHLFEDIIIMKSGRVIESCSCEELVSGAYAVSGPEASVDTYAAGLDVLGTERLGQLKTVYIRGEAQTGRLSADLEISRANLQKLFIQMTSEEEELA